MSSVKSIPKDILSLCCQNKVVVVLVLLGLIIRLAVMPITIHHDILSSIWRSSLLVFEGSYRIGNFSELIMAGYLFLTQHFFNQIHDIFNGHFSLTIGPDHQVYADFLNSTYSYRYIFLTKFLFLVFDIILLIVILKSHLKKNLHVIIFWALNPFIIYSVFAWGRYEILPVVLTMISMISAYNKKYLWAIILAGLAISFRITFFLYLIPLVIFIARDKKEYLLYSAIGLLPNFITSSITKLFIEAPSGSIGGFQELLLTGQIGGQGFTTISLFPMAVFTIGYLMLLDKKKNRLDFKLYFFYTACIIASYFAFTQFHPQWLAWITPVALISIYYQKKTMYSFLFLFVVFYLFIDSFWGPYTSTYLFAEASNPNFAHSFFSIKYQLMQKYSDNTLNTGFHTLFVAGLILILTQLKGCLYDKKI